MPCAQFRESLVKTVLTKNLKRKSGSFADEGESKREKVCFTGFGNGRLTMAPGCLGVTLTFPKTFCKYELKREFISGVKKDERISVCRRYFA